jgi:2-amino-4-ketopentanoate thiolase alpha subunit
MIKKNTFVQIYKEVLSIKDRATHIPDDTKLVPFEMRVKGILLKDADLMDIVEIKTATNRIETGILINSEPFYSHSYGHHVKELVDIRHIILSEMGEYEDE